MCKAIVALTGTGAAYCQSAPGPDGFCSAHQPAKSAPAQPKADGTDPQEDQPASVR
jgi:hypothetical protein